MATGSISINPRSCAIAVMYASLKIPPLKLVTNEYTLSFSIDKQSKFLWLHPTIEGVKVPPIAVTRALPPGVSFYGLQHKIQFLAPGYRSHLILLIVCILPDTFVSTKSDFGLWLHHDSGSNLHAYTDAYLKAFSNTDWARCLIMSPL
ncbi:hypothetical protein R6Q59_028600 [Mikania micrantha]